MSRDCLQSARRPDLSAHGITPPSFDLMPSLSIVAVRDGRTSCCRKIFTSPARSNSLLRLHSNGAESDHLPIHSKHDLAETFADLRVHDDAVAQTQRGIGIECDGGSI